MPYQTELSLTCNQTQFAFLPNQSENCLEEQIPFINIEAIAKRCGAKNNFKRVFCKKYIVQKGGQGSIGVYEGGDGRLH